MTQTKVYRVREGVEWVNGARVPEDRLVTLTAAQARFDLEQGRIELDKPSIDPVVGVAAVEAEVAKVERSIKQRAHRGGKKSASDG